MSNLNENNKNEMKAPTYIVTREGSEDVIYADNEKDAINKAEQIATLYGVTTYIGKLMFSVKPTSNKVTPKVKLDLDNLN